MPLYIQMTNILFCNLLFSFKNIPDEPPCQYLAMPPSVIAYRIDVQSGYYQPPLFSSSNLSGASHSVLPIWCPSPWSLFLPSMLYARPYQSDLIRYLPRQSHLYSPIPLLDTCSGMFLTLLFIKTACKCPSITDYSIELSFIILYSRLLCNH